MGKVSFRGGDIFKFNLNLLDRSFVLHETDDRPRRMDCFHPAPPLMPKQGRSGTPKRTSLPEVPVNILWGFDKKVNDSEQKDAGQLSKLSLFPHGKTN